MEKLDLLYDQEGIQVGIDTEKDLYWLHVGKVYLGFPFEGFFDSFGRCKTESDLVEKIKMLHPEADLVIPFEDRGKVKTAIEEAGKENERRYQNWLRNGCFVDEE